MIHRLLPDTEVGVEATLPDSDVVPKILVEQVIKDSDRDNQDD